MEKNGGTYIIRPISGTVFVVVSQTCERRVVEDFPEILDQCSSDDVATFRFFSYGCSQMNDTLNLLSI